MLISKLKTPVIAQVHGAATNGMGLVAASDLAIAADNIKMGLTAINVGLNCVGAGDSRGQGVLDKKRHWNCCFTVNWSRQIKPWS